MNHTADASGARTNAFNDTSLSQTCAQELIPSVEGDSDSQIDAASAFGVNMRASIDAEINCDSTASGNENLQESMPSYLSAFEKEDLHPIKLIKGQLSMKLESSFLTNNKSVHIELNM